MLIQLLVVSLLTFASTAATAATWSVHGTLAMGDGRGIAILREGQGEQLSVRRGNELPGGARLVRVEVQSVVVDFGQGPVTLALGDSLQPPRQQPTTRQSLRAQLQRSRIHALAKSPIELIKEAEIAPVFGGNGIRGYRIASLKDGGLGRELGLAPGDIVTAINGVVMNRYADANVLYRDLQNESTLDIQLERNGAPMSLQIELN